MAKKRRSLRRSRKPLKRKFRRKAIRRKLRARSRRRIVKKAGSKRPSQSSMTRSRRAAHTRTRSQKTKDTPLLEGLTGSPARARLLRVLLREPQVSFRTADVSERIGIPTAALKKELRLLESLGIVQLKGGVKRAQVLVSFPFAGELRMLAAQSFPISRAQLTKILSRVGKLRLVVVSGIFLNVERTRVDLFVVAQRYSEKRMEAAVRRLEETIGAELRWAGMETKEFLYRWNMFDRFVRDILTQPHEKVFEKIKL